MLMMPRLFGENLFDDFFDDFDRDFTRMYKHNPLYGKNAGKIMKTDVKEKDGNYEVDVDLPGFKKDEVFIQLENGYLTITASKGTEKDEKEKEDSGYIRKERWSGSCTRSFYVGENVRSEDIKAKMEDGILHLTMPKEQPKALPKQNTILIEG